MLSATQISMTAFLLFGAAPAPEVEDAPEKQWVWLLNQGVFGFGYQIEDGPHRGLWRIDEGSKRPPAEVAPPQAVGDPYGFAGFLNAYRASAGLPPLDYDADLSGWAAQNNSAQAARGLGHFVNPNCFQNCAWNTADAASTADQWVASPAHRDNMLTRSARSYGIAFGPGPYWTLNLR